MHLSGGVEIYYGSFRARWERRKDRKDRKKGQRTRKKSLEKAGQTARGTERLTARRLKPRGQPNRHAKFQERDRATATTFLSTLWKKPKSESRVRISPVARRCLFRWGPVLRPYVHVSFPSVSTNQIARNSFAPTFLSDKVSSDGDWAFSPRQQKPPQLVSVTPIDGPIAFQIKPKTSVNCHVKCNLKGNR
ncbi:hypothetical protein O6H91_06G060400 [Diphasiastrum complanatum]|uniref:Uncharacterized protein n=1 Tax=Diphasiastrum complanatum TaxID=34168 RepID=A0ACC2DEF1_DIPCM|nr:hypothetical protein O6H91_06G060400 [Diphasiastrum complanatum]